VPLSAAFSFASFLAAPGKEKKICYVGEQPYFVGLTD
jgi:nanoRNase/pAp phosphatase (c-di-AMP/oligoRNAs hydrolase)